VDEDTAKTLKPLPYLNSSFLIPHSIFKKGDVIIKSVEFGVWRVKLTANGKDKTIGAPLSCQASELPSCQKGEYHGKNC